MAKKYYSKLYKEYALVDLSRYETGQIGCRWRT
jgi:protein FRA10AC1